MKIGSILKENIEAINLKKIGTIFHKKRENEQK